MWVAVLVSGGLCWVGLIVGAVGWQVWDSWVVDVVLLVLHPSDKWFDYHLLHSVNLFTVYTFSAIYSYDNSQPS